MNVVVIAPHPDDEAIGCGGALRLHADAGDRTVAVFLSSGELGLKHLPKEEAWRIREGEASVAAQHLGLARTEFCRQPDWFVSDHIAVLAESLSALLRQELPEIVYVPHAADGHPDHQAALPILLEAARRIPQFTPRILGYEVWTPIQAAIDFRDITSVMAQKMKAVRCYKSQLAAFRYDHAIRGLNQFRGVMSGGCRYAEAFQDFPIIAATSVAVP
jgi:N-acetylglucosamine malate deacetylase 1